MKTVNIDLDFLMKEQDVKDYSKNTNNSKIGESGM